MSFLIYQMLIMYKVIVFFKCGDYLQEERKVVRSSLKARSAVAEVVEAMNRFIYSRIM